MGEGINAYIDEARCKVVYGKFDHATPFLTRFGKRSLLAKINVKATYRLLPMRQTDAKHNLPRPSSVTPGRGTNARPQGNVQTRFSHLRSLCQGHGSSVEERPMHKPPPPPQQDKGALLSPALNCVLYNNNGLIRTSSTNI